MPYILKILASPEKKRDGQRFELKDGETVAGRVSPPADFLLEGTKVSKKHCVFKVNGMSVRVDDLKSSNGLFVNGKKVDFAELKEKDRLVVGDYILELLIGTVDGASPKPPVVPPPKGGAK